MTTKKELYIMLINMGYDLEALENEVAALKDVTKKMKTELTKLKSENKKGAKILPLAKSPKVVKKKVGRPKKK